MRITRTIAYAIHATLELAEHNNGSPISCSELAQRRGMPPRFLLQVLRTLVKKGILRSSQGVFGGYSLNRDPNSITLWEIVDALDEPLSSFLPQSPPFSRSVHEQLVATLSRTANAAKSEMNKLTIADLARAATCDQRSVTTIAGSPQNNIEALAIDGPCNLSPTASLAGNF